jgi:hypothetical protein
MTATDTCLIAGLDLDECHLPFLEFVVEMLLEVDILGRLTSSDDMVAPFDASHIDPVFLE